MKVYVCENYDHKTGKHLCKGIDFEECAGDAYDLCMWEMNHYPKDKDEDRFEFFCTEENIDFQWDMSEEQFEMVKHPPKERTEEDYLGSLFFGNCKLEFCLMQDDGVSYPYCNMFVREIEGYAMLWDGTPYNDYEGFAAQIDNSLPKRRTFEAFARHIEHNIIESLNEYRQLIDSALMKTEPDAWYSIEHVLIKPTRRA